MLIQDAMSQAVASSDAELVERASSHMGRADFQEVLCDCHELAHRFAQARAEARAAALEEAAEIARYCTIHDGDDAGWLQCAEYILARLRALIEVKA